MLFSCQRSVGSRLTPQRIFGGDRRQGDFLHPVSARTGVSSRASERGRARPQPRRLFDAQPLTSRVKESAASAFLINNLKHDSQS
jgi:hypothetical protein